MSRQMIRSSDVKGNTSYDIILRAFLDHKIHELPAELSGMVERWKMVDKLIRRGELTTVMNINTGDLEEKTKRFSFSDIVDYLTENFKVSTRTAYEDIKNAKRFFLSCEGRTDVEYNRIISIEIGEMMMYAAFEAGDLKSAAAFYKELNIIKHLHEQREDTPDYADFIPPTFVLVADASELGFEPIENHNEVVKRILNEKRINFIDKEATDAEVDE